MSRVRQQQRSDHYLYFKAVEIGSASNFLVDQLLKTRAGENVVALMTAITPILNETSCTAIISHLFETAKAPLDNTPGIGELGKFREALLPFSRKTEFGEKVLQYHHLLQAFECRSETNAGQEKNPYEAIPHDKDIALILQMLFKVTLNQGLIFTYNGITGAGWVAAYASYVLGLPTCAIKASGSTLPINTTYEEAKVVIRISSPSDVNTCEISRAGDLEDFISLESNGLTRTGWSVDCSIVSFLDMNCPGLRQMPDFQVLCEFVGIELLNMISDLARHFTNDSDLDLKTTLGEMDGHDDETVGNHTTELLHNSFCRYSLSVLTDLRFRGLRILEILGFLPGVLDDYTVKARGACHDYYCVGRKMGTLDSQLSGHTPGSDDKIPGLERDEDTEADLKELGDYRLEHCEQSCLIRALRANGQYLHYGSARDRTNSEKTTSRLNYYMQSNSAQLPPRRHSVDEDGDAQSHLTFMTRPATLRKQVCHAIINAVDIAAKLAFTDWDTSLKLLSVRYFHQAGMKISCKYDSFRTAPSVLQGHLESAIQLCTDIFETTTLEKHVFTPDWAGVDLDGIVVLRSSVTRRSIRDLRGRYLEFRLGRIKFEDSLVRSIRVDIVSSETFKDRALQTRPDKVDDHSKTVGPELSPQCTPNLDPMEFRCSFTMIERILLLKLECLTNEGSWVQVDPIEISKSIPRLFVTVSCTHPFRAPLSLHGTMKKSTGMPRAPGNGLPISNWYQDSAFDIPERLGLAVQYTPDGFDIAYLHVDRSAEGQWLSCRSAYVENGGPKDLPTFGYTLLQKNTCLLCTVHTISSNKALNGYWQVRIIPYGDEVVEHTVDQLSTPSFRFCQNYQSMSYRIWRKHLTSVSGYQKKKSNYVLEALSDARTKRTCPGSLHTPCCIRRCADPCIICVPEICRDDVKRPPCGSCEEIYLMYYSDIKKQFKAESESAMRMKASARKTDCNAAETGTNRQTNTGAWETSSVNPEKRKD